MSEHESAWQPDVPMLTALVVVLVVVVAVGAWLHNEKQDRISRCYDREFTSRVVSADLNAVVACLRREGVSDEEIARQFGGG